MASNDPPSDTSDLLSLTQPDNTDIDEPKRKEEVEEVTTEEEEEDKKRERSVSYLSCIQ